ncbi:MAG: triose-phosphate isomerase [Desulfurococcales archaeon]|nr:triose-phosphate isomerase [Desulfurococcales archaeon]
MRVLVVNFKAYPTAFDSTAEALAREASRLESGLPVRVILAPPAPVVPRVLAIHGDVYTQHLDPVGMGAHTGRIPAEAARALGVRGSLVNHSERKMVLRDVAAVVSKLREQGLESIVCADTPAEAAAAAYLKPTMVAVEPPELIGTGIPVSKARPEVITESLEAIRKVDPALPLLAGAGISSPEDAVRAVELGASGVLVASIVMKSRDPPASMRSLAEALATA